SAERFHARTSKPACARWRAIGAPMMPVPSTATDALILPPWGSDSGMTLPQALAPETLDVLDPRSGAVLGTIPAGDAAAADAAVRRACAAQGAWARTAPGERAAALKAGARALRAHLDELAELQTAENGK